MGIFRQSHSLALPDGRHFVGHRLSNPKAELDAIDYHDWLINTSQKSYNDSHNKLRAIPELVDAEKEIKKMKSCDKNSMKLNGDLEEIKINISDDTVSFYTDHPQIYQLDDKNKIVWGLDYPHGSEDASKRIELSHPPPPQDNRAIVITTFEDDESDGRPTPRNVVRYNDMGSFEQVSDTSVEFMDETALKAIDTAEQQNAKKQYYELWKLRATLEEGDTDDNVDYVAGADKESSPEVSPELGEEQTGSTSFESNTEPPYLEEIDHPRYVHSVDRDAFLLTPTYKAKRKHFRGILNRCLHKIEANTSTETSFDSVDTDAKDASEQGGAVTTSFESTTDNSDSTGDSQTKLQQMKADSGYKSMEILQKSASVDKKLPAEKQAAAKNGEPGNDVPKRITHVHRCIDRKGLKTASKKRKEYTRERQFAAKFEPVFEPGDVPRYTSSVSFDDSLSKTTVFSRFFKSNSEYFDQQPPRYSPHIERDYSIDEKTDTLFKEFLKQEFYDDLPNNPWVTRSPRLYQRHKFSHRHDDNQWTRHLSPQDSIEEEHCQNEDANHYSENIVWHKQSNNEHKVSTHDIPIIRLPDI